MQMAHVSCNYLYEHYNV